MLDLRLLSKEYRILREVCFAYALKGDAEDLTKFFAESRSSADMTPAVIYNEIVSKAIHRIRSLGLQRKLDSAQQEEAITVILKSFGQLKDSGPVQQEKSPRR
ncbi:MAG TPA: hypothetical protein VIH68_05575 [Bacteroidota bacterium]